MIFWLFNIFIIDLPWRMPFEIKEIFQIISLIVFFAIFYKVAKWTK